ncbi:N-acetylglutamate synthase [hydrothermal vent metagenome]|uniref:N-acetylglutamate synthase n=1 Tax=hydrothermal vent metagenome TaxID=652676 RepID=A0A3B1DK52_9ZZZZ
MNYKKTSNSKSLRIRKAGTRDVREIHRLVNSFAKREQMLPRSLNEIYETLRDHIVCEDNGEVTGVCALHILWEDLAEIRSLAVKADAQRQGTGKKLVKSCISEAKRLGIERIFVLTYNPDFFRSLGFVDIDKSELPQKIWGDCLRCHKFPECDEFALIKKV